MIYFSMKELLWKQIIKKKKKTFFFGMLKNDHRLKTRFNKKKGQVFHGKWARNVKTDRDYGNLLLRFPLFQASLWG